MSPFLPEYAEQMNKPIFTGVTALAIDSGEVVILEFGQGLWFGKRTEPLKWKIMLITIVLEPTFDQFNSLMRSALCLRSSQNMHKI